MEGLLKLESADTLASRCVASEIHKRLNRTRDPLLLGELVDFYFETYSKRTRKILTTLGEAHSQVGEAVMILSKRCVVSLFFGSLCIRISLTSCVSVC